ncbi:uncharacterized protein [Dermacentor albipictus]|uniref:uncharacterized protein n=1 Tax=Dermacentor albipictus TaxID=60249 RepID=UPI0038FC7374
MNYFALFMLCLIAYASAQKTKRKMHSGGGNEPTVFHGEFTDYMLKVQHHCRMRHNSYRRLHGVPDLKHSDELSNYAQAWAERLAETGQFKHRSKSPYGENIYMSYNSDPNFQVNGSAPVDSWYSEIKYHNYDSDNFNPRTGHFTQVIGRTAAGWELASLSHETGKCSLCPTTSPEETLWVSSDRTAQGQNTVAEWIKAKVVESKCKDLGSAESVIIWFFRDRLPPLTLPTRAKDDLFHALKMQAIGGKFHHWKSWRHRRRDMA